MKNKLEVLLKDGIEVEIGDPFILRFNGKYYLYPSSSDEIEGIRCFKSLDLIHYEDMGLVAKSPLLKHAYAPEVLYHNDEFIMVTSPNGNGHYFLKSRSPLGPFTFITNNLSNMIDGSFVLDKNNEIHFLRADHNGISYLDFKNDLLVNRKDLVGQISRAWTEGPSITYFKKHYYLTYCGNNVLSDNYRVKIAVSDKIDDNYRTQVSPLVLSTKSDFKALGHNCVILGPSLDEYFLAYHTLRWIDEKRTMRYLCLDRLYLNGYNCACNVCDFSQSEPRRPDFECDISENSLLMQKLGNFLLTTSKHAKEFTAEFNFKGNTSIILGYQNIDNYFKLECFDRMIRLIKKVNNSEKILFKKCIKFSFNDFHSIRIINTNKMEILIDNVNVGYLPKVTKGYCGYIIKNNLFYTAFTNSVYTNSLKDTPINIPGKLEANYGLGSYKLVNTFEKIKAAKLVKNQTIKFKINSKGGKYYLLSRIRNCDVTLEVKSSLETKTIRVNKNDSSYLFNVRDLGFIKISKQDLLSIKVLKGSLEVMYFIVEKEELKLNNSFCDYKSGVKYFFSDYAISQSLKFRVNELKKDSLFGLIFGSKNYVNSDNAFDLRYIGYFIGFDKSLLVIDYCQYDRTRIYDKPYPLNENKVYDLRVEFFENVIKVYINDTLEITTSTKYDYTHGYCGIFTNENSNVSYLNYERRD